MKKNPRVVAEAVFKAVMELMKVHSQRELNVAGEKQPRNVHDNTKMLSKSLQDLEAFGRTQTTLAGSEASPRVTDTLLPKQTRASIRML